MDAGSQLAQDVVEWAVARGCRVHKLQLAASELGGVEFVAGEDIFPYEVVIRLDRRAIIGPWLVHQTPLSGIVEDDPEFFLSNDSFNTLLLVVLWELRLGEASSYRPYLVQAAEAVRMCLPTNFQSPFWRKMRGQRRMDEKERLGQLNPRLLAKGHPCFSAQEMTLAAGIIESRAFCLENMEFCLLPIVDLMNHDGYENFQVNKVSPRGQRIRTSRKGSSQSRFSFSKAEQFFDLKHYCPRHLADSLGRIESFVYKNQSIIGTDYSPQHFKELKLSDLIGEAQKIVIKIHRKNGLKANPLYLPNFWNRESKGSERISSGEPLSGDPEAEIDDLLQFELIFKKFLAKKKIKNVSVSAKECDCFRQEDRVDQKRLEKTGSKPNSMVIVASNQSGRAVKRGEIVRNSYGPLPNLDLLARYGFCLPDNPNQTLRIWEDPKISGQESPIRKFLLEFDDPKGAPAYEVLPKQFSGRLFSRFLKNGFTKTASLDLYRNFWEQISAKITSETLRVAPEGASSLSWEAAYFLSLDQIAKDQLQATNFLQRYEKLRLSDPDADVFDALEPGTATLNWLAFGCREYFK